MEQPFNCSNNEMHAASNIYIMLYVMHICEEDT